MLVVFSGLQHSWRLSSIDRFLPFHWFGTFFFLFHRRLHSSLRAMALIFLHPGFDPILLLHLTVSVEEHILFSCALIRPAGIHFGTAACADCPPANRGPGGCSLSSLLLFDELFSMLPVLHIHLQMSSIRHEKKRYSPFKSRLICFFFVPPLVHSEVAWSFFLSTSPFALSM
jgi:hypothetical protein